jgi:hypothetical protein
VNQIVENRPTETVLETNFGNQAQIEFVPYGLLCRLPSNARKKAPTGIEELAITIEAKSLMQTSLRTRSYIADPVLHRLATHRLIATSQEVT